MKTRIALLLVMSLVAQSSFGQQASNAPSPENVSTAPPPRYSVNEMIRFRAMQAASIAAPADGLNVSHDETNKATNVPVVVGNLVQPTSYQTRAGNSDSSRSPQEAPQASAPNKDSNPVPAILSGTQSSEAQPKAPSQIMPDEVSMNQPQVTPTAGKGDFPIAGPRNSNLPTMKTYIKPKAGAPALSPTMPNPGQPPVDLRREPSPVYQANRPQASPGGIATVSGKQEPTESLNGSSIPAATNGPKQTSTAEASTAAANPASTGGTSTQLAVPGTTVEGGKTAKLANTNTTLNNTTPASSRSMLNAADDQTTINTPGAAISVSTTGPKSISIGKNAAFGVVVANSGQTAAQQLEVTFTVPTWIELANINLTTGAKELLRETDATRIVWRLDRLEPGKSQRLTLDVIPRKAQVFDLNVEWSVAPLMGAVQVQVTEPLLKMSITGPDEVQFGESVMYTVVVQNPGTGIAENVNVMLSEALGGERAPLGNLGPGEEKNIQVELIARSAGALDLSAGVSGDGDLQDNASKKITVRRAQLDVAIQGPSMKYSGSTGNYQITVENTGDAIAQDIFAAIGFPVGAQYISGIEGAEKIEGGMRWSVGALPPGAKRTFTVACQLNSAGPLQIETGVRGAGDLADADSIQTIVETEADLVLSVDDPQGPLPVGQDATYKLCVKNRGTKTANDIDIVMHFSTGIEPASAEGREHKINPGEVVFESIGQLDPGEEKVFTVTARATVPGTHEFRAQMTCEEADAREVTGGTTKFFGNDDYETNVSDPSIQVGEQPTINNIRK